MKKLILSVTMLAIAATTIFVACKKEEVKQAEPTKSKSSTALFKKKGAFYYACVDAAGAITYGKLGSALGPTGTAGGIVLGGVAASAWEYYWDNCTIAVPTPTPVPMPGAGFNSFSDQFEKVGYLHNKFLLSTNGMTYNNTTILTINSFVELYYDSLTSFCAIEYGIPVVDFRTTFTKASLVARLTSYEAVKAANFSTYETWINQTVNAPNQVATFLNSVITDVEALNDDNDDINAYLLTKIAAVSISTNFNQFDKDIILYSLSTFRYSNALWHGI
jgi:hypothetical protein